ncbi:MAG: sulfotransferase [Mycobacterium sp.]|nr:sulfotransferase [Mycobacterium sp.]
MGEFDHVATPDDLLKVAAQRTGLSELDSESWREGSSILLDEVNESSAFTPGGREHVMGLFTDALSRRLRVHDYLQTHASVLDEPVEKPLIIIGMPRTGTTVISCLLDQDPQRRSLLHWECMDPVPPASPDAHRSDPRCLALLEEQAAILKFVQEAKMPLPHWEDADGPTEDMFIHTQDFKGLAWDAYMASPRYSEWLFNDADLTSTYEYQKRYLQVLQSTIPGTWSLKMPSHSVFLDTLLAVFPDARLIWAHRDPFKAAGSLANLHMLPKSTVQHAEAIDRQALGRNVMTQMQQHVDRPLRTRERIGDERFFHMHYSDMMRDPIDVMRRIYDWAGDEFTGDVENRMRTWLADHPQTRFGANKYTLEEYGLSVQELEPVFAEYLSEFDIELETKKA